MTIQDDIEIMEAEKRRLYLLHIAPIEEKIQNAYRQLNEQKVEPDLMKIDIVAITDKYKTLETEATKSIG
jgi:hypothetical protein